MGNPEYASDEIDLMPYIRIIAKRKKTVITVLIICIAIAVAATLILPKAYEAKAIIRIGKISDFVIPKAEALQMLGNRRLLGPILSKYDISIEDISETALRRMVDALDIKDTAFIAIRVHNQSKILALKICQEIAENFVAEGRKIYALKTAFLNEQITGLEKRSNTLENIIKDAEKKQAGNIRNLDFLLLQDYEIYRSLKDILAMKEVLIDAKDFEVFEPPAEPRIPVTRSLTANISVALFLGLILGVFLAFFQEHYRTTA